MTFGGPLFGGERDGVPMPRLPRLAIRRTRRVPAEAPLRGRREEPRRKLGGGAAGVGFRTVVSPDEGRE